MSTEQQLIDFARREFEKNLQLRSSNLEASQMRVLRHVSADLDGDGRHEAIMVAGIPSLWFPATCVLLDDAAGPTVVIPYEEGFSDLRVREADRHGRRQFVLFWRLGSGAMLTTHMVEWDGHMLHFVLDAPVLNQGLFELKDLDGDGEEEVLLLEALPDEGANWSPHLYGIHVYARADSGYRARQGMTTEHRFHPSSIVSQRIGLFGLPVDPSDRGVSVDRRRAQLVEHLASGTVDPKFVEGLAAEADRLRPERFVEDAVILYDLALRGAEAVRSEQSRESLRLKAYWDKGVALSMLGRVFDAAASYRKAVELFSRNAWPDSKAPHGRLGHLPRTDRRTPHA